MVQQILDDMRAYLGAKPSPTPQEQALLQQLNKGFFPITSVSRDDLKACGFDTRFITDEQMCELAKRMAADYCEQLFWSSLKIIAEGLECRLYSECPCCGSRHVQTNEQSRIISCEDCRLEWLEHLYVLVEFPEDASYFEERGIGYPSFESKDNGAMYVPEYDYITYFKKYPEPNRYFKPIRWPESQPYLFPDETNDALDSLIEPIKDEWGIEDFDVDAVWVPVCMLKKSL